MGSSRDAKCCGACEPREQHKLFHQRAFRRPCLLCTHNSRQQNRHRLPTICHPPPPTCGKLGQGSAATPRAGAQHLPARRRPPRHRRPRIPAASQLKGNMGAAHVQQRSQVQTGYLREGVTSSFASQEKIDKQITKPTCWYPAPTTRCCQVPGPRSGAPWMSRPAMVTYWTPAGQEGRATQLKERRLAIPVDRGRQGCAL